MDNGIRIQGLTKSFRRRASTKPRTACSTVWI